MKKDILDGLPEVKVINLVPRFVRDLPKRKIRGDGRIQLNLDNDRFFGFEFQGGLSNMVLASVIKGIEKGDKLPPVGVIRIKDRYYLNPKVRRAEGGIDGGHYRSFARYATHTLLDCVLTDDFWFPVKYIEVDALSRYLADDFTSVSDAKVRDDMSIAYDVDTDEPVSVYVEKGIMQDQNYRKVETEEASLILNRYSIPVLGTV